jgi:hypothetical protein
MTSNDLERKEGTKTNEKRFGPGFVSSTSRLIRGEYALIAVATLAYLVWSYRSGIGLIPLSALIFFAVLPDLVSFIPIGLFSTRELEKGEWPSWGSSLYNAFHTILVWAAVFGVTWVLLGNPYLPLLGWLIHITADRSAGYSLRAKK